MFIKVTTPVLILLALSLNCSAKKLTVAFGNTLAPWVMTESHNGILIELITEAMEPLGYEVEKVYYPYARRIKSYQLNEVDVVCDINQNNISNSNLKGHFSGIIYAYKNYAFSLNKRKFNIRKVSELSQYSILSWQGARKHLGASYDLMAANNPFYLETHDQKQQVKMLYLERVDFIQLDRKIFEFYRSKLIEEKEINAKVKVDRFALFGTNPNGFLFRNLKARDDFVKQVKLMKKDGRYNKIFDKHSQTNTPY